MKLYRYITLIPKTCEKKGCHKPATHQIEGRDLLWRVQMYVCEDCMKELRPLPTKNWEQ